MEDSRTKTMLSPNIILGRGIGPLRFGMYPNETLEILGEPNISDLRVPKSSAGAVVHCYPHLGLDLTFDEEDDHRLAYIDINHGNFILMNALTLGMDWRDCKRQGKVLGLGIPTEERCAKWDLQCYHAHSLICWFKDKTLVRISFGHYWTRDGKPIWPEV